MTVQSAVAAAKMVTSSTSQEVTKSRCLSAASAHLPQRFEGEAGGLYLSVLLDLLSETGGASKMTSGECAEHE